MGNQITKTIWSGLFLSLLSFTHADAQRAGCGGCDRFWVEADYLYWQIKPSPEPVPLIATAPVIADQAPVIGEPGASVVLGGKSVHTPWRSGAKFALGYWFDDDHALGVEANYFFLSSASKKQSVFSSGLPGSAYLAVPFFDTTTNSESSSPVATPGQFLGSAKLNVTNSLQGAELNAVGALCITDSYNISALVGFRYLNFDENLKFFVNSPAINIPGEVYQVTDHFRTENNFYGGQIGFGINSSCSCISVNAQAKVAIGAMCEKANIKGKFYTNALNGIGTPVTYEGGYFALPSNSGHYSETCFAVIPEINLNLGYQATDCLRLNIGYSFLYVNKVLWAGKQMNRNINPTQSVLYEFTTTPVLVGEAVPTAKLKNSSFWAQGLNVGLEYSF